MSRILQVLLVSALVGGLLQVDHSVQSLVQSARSPAGERAMRLATEIGRRDVVAYGLLAIALLDGAQGVATVRLAVVSVVGANLVVEGLKRLVGRTRPDGERKPSNSSFPSGHAASAAGLAVILARRWKRLTIGFWLLAAVVCFSRIYLNRHFLSDVLCGVAIGITSSVLVLRLWPAERRKEAKGT